MYSSIADILERLVNNSSLRVCWNVVSRLGKYVVCGTFCYFAIRRGLCYARLYVGPYLFSALIHVTSERIYPSLRANFQQMTIPTLLSAANHTHPHAAADRASANVFINDIIIQAGFRPFSVSASGRDIRTGMDGNRLFHFAKDCAMKFRGSFYNKHHVLKMVDVDYYCHLPDYLRAGRPLLLYTFCPLNVAGSVKNATYTIINDLVHLDVNGGAKYVHPIWDLEGDSFVSDHWWGSQIYLVDHRLTDEPTRRLVAIYPVRTIYGPWGWLLPGKRFQRRIYQYDSINFSRYQITNKGDIQPKIMISFGRPGERDCSVVTERTFHTATVRCGLAKDPSISDVERIFRSDEVSNPTYSASLFIKYFKLSPKTFERIIDVITLPFVGNDDVNYQTLRPLVTEDGKPMARNVFPALCRGGAVAPVRSFNNDHACVQRRIEDVKNGVVKVPPFYRKCRQEFVSLLIPDELMHTGVPWTEAMVEKRQNRPTQRAANERTKPFSFLSKFIIKSFQKGETYGKICPPRNISTLPTDHRLRYGAFIYAITEILKSHDWYAFGKNPQQLEVILMDIASRATSILPTDYEMWDGTHSLFMAEYELMLLLRFFAEPYHEELVTLQKDHYFAPCLTAFMVKYCSDFTRPSGSSDTSVFNTGDNALIAYIVIRHFVSDPTTAFRMLGIYGGDDGITPNVPIDLYTKVVTKLGHKIKCELITPGNPVPFLGRIFIDLWSTPASICDPLRRVRALHLTVVPKTIPDALILHRKADGYEITDSETPVIKSWISLVRRLVPRTNVPKTMTEGIEQILRVESSWFSQYDLAVNFTRPEPDDALRVAASSFGITVNELTNIIHRLDNIVSVEELRTFIPFSFERKVTVTATLKGEIRQENKRPPVLRRNLPHGTERLWRSWRPHPRPTRC